MTRQDFIDKATELYNAGMIDSDTYEAMVANAGAFCEDDDNDCYGLPSTYAEIEYDDFENAEAIDGARFDDMNYLRYTER